MAFAHSFVPMPPALSVLCGISDPSAALGIALALFLTGLAGGLAHCGPMCGPFVVMQLAIRGPDEHRQRRVAGGVLPAYHLGRATTYVALGAAAGGLGGTIAALAPLRFALAALLTTAAFGFLLQAVKPVWSNVRPPARGFGIATLLTALTGPLVRRFAGRSGYVLGLVLGFLPCGFLYSALIAAGATGSIFAGGGAMAAFALGTVPALAGVGLLGAVAMRRWRSLGAAIAPPVFLLNAITLAAFAWRALP